MVHGKLDMENKHGLCVFKIFSSSDCKIVATECGEGHMGSNILDKCSPHGANMDSENSSVTDEHNEPDGDKTKDDKAATESRKKEDSSDDPKATNR